MNCAYCGQRMECPNCCPEDSTQSRFSLSMVAKSIARERIEQIAAFPSHEEHGTPGWVTITEKDRDALVITARAWFDAADAGERAVKRALKSNWHCARCGCFIEDASSAVYVAEGSGIAHPTCVQSPEPSHTMTELSQDEALDMLEKLRPERPDRFFLDCDDIGRWSIKGWKDKDEAKREIARLNATI